MSGFRRIGILSVLLQKDKTTAPELAEKFEVSRRTISRDIETLCRAAEPGQRQRQQILRTADGTAEAGFSPRQAPLPDLSNEQIFPAGMQARVLFDPDMKWRLTEEFGPHSFETRADGRLIFD